ncbi:hypothetical protein VTJ04DRAFT_990 [Mycothermus thermophilus]|uniref:uncharacterized protein n=1 Tax=Humicola insolens TaxID=85995 RepID=UPI003743287F
MKGSPSPFLTLSMRNFLMFGQMSEPQAYTKNLLALARHYDVPRDDELSQVARKMGIGNNGDVLKVGTFWTFTIGPGILITLSCLSLAEIIDRGLVEMDNKANGSFYTVKVVMLDDEEASFRLVIDTDCS